MRKLALLSLIGACGSAFAAPLYMEFDDLATGLAPASYMTFDMDPNMGIYNQTLMTANYGNNYPIPSQTQFLYNGFGDPSVTMDRVADFDFIGGYFATWGYNEADWSDGSETITIEGWDDGSLVGTVTKDLDPDGFKYVGANFVSVDTLIFKSDGQSRWWVGDSFKFDNVEAVPEPGTMAALGLGLAAIARRRRSAK